MRRASVDVVPVTEDVSESDPVQTGMPAAETSEATVVAQPPPRRLLSRARARCTQPV